MLKRGAVVVGDDVIIRASMEKKDGMSISHKVRLRGQPPPGEPIVLLFGYNCYTIMVECAFASTRRRAAR